MTARPASDLRGVLGRTLAVTAGYIAATWLMHSLVFSRYHRSAGVSLGLAFAFVQSVTIIFLLLASLSAKLRKQIREWRSAHIRPAIEQRLATHLAGEDELEALRAYKRRHAATLEDVVVRFLSSVRGIGQDRMSRIALDLGLVERWSRSSRSRNPRRRANAVVRLGQLSSHFAAEPLAAALEDTDERVRIEAARSLLRSSRPDLIAEAFRSALNQPLLIRALLVEDLRPHALTLCAETIPAVLKSGDPKTTVVTLQIVRGWGKALPIPDLKAALRHPEPGVRAAAYRVLPLAIGLESRDEWILCALEQDGSADVKCAAAFSASCLKLAPAVPALARCLREPDAGLALEAARALASIGPVGWQVLETEVLTAPPAVASAALEALGRVRLGLAASGI